mmetsp:Transcript_6459/g.12167  ORF Transcript_6459/g.12167 Transcript_6459/m.12167 type:complete len:114 (-) Transcript_6459:1342-1683(-)
MVISTLDSLASSYSCCGDNMNALFVLKEIMKRVKTAGQHKIADPIQMKQTIANLLYKVSKIHRRQNDFESARDTLHEIIPYVKKLDDSTFLQNVNDELAQIDQVEKSNKLDWL